MSRLFALVLAFVPTVALAADPAPEAILSPTSQLYFRWDGVTAHAETYKNSYWGGLMAGPTGDSIRALAAKLPKLAGNAVLAEPLLDGKPPSELKANLTDLKNAAKVLDMLADTGVIVAAEMGEPRGSMASVGKVLEGLFTGKKPDLPDGLVPPLQLFVIVPDVGDRSAVMFSAMRLAMSSNKYKIAPFTAAGRKGFRVGENAVAEGLPTGRRNLDRDGIYDYEPRTAWWLEGKHFVFYLGTKKIEHMVAQVDANIKSGGIAKHPLFQRCNQKPEFASVARGFIDSGRLIALTKTVAGPFVPGLAPRLDDLGVGNLKAVVFKSGFDGKESRSVWELDIPGPRKGVAKIVKNVPIRLADLPPMPPDVNRFLAMRVDPEAIFDTGIGLVETLAASADFGVEDEAKSPSEKIRLRREFLVREFDKAAGLNMRDELLPALGDKLVVFQSPNEGLLILGTVFCISLKDPAKAKAITDRVHTSLEALISTPVKVRKKMVKGVEISEMYTRGFGFLTPTYSIVDGWLVVSLHPQGTQGVVLRAKGEIPAWKPDAETAARIAKLPADACAFQFCDPRPTVKNLCCVGPLAIGGISELSRRFNDREGGFEPTEVGLIPNGHELSKHLFPNLTVIRDDGKTLRIEANESFSLPLEILGVEMLGALFGRFGGVLIEGEQMEGGVSHQLRANRLPVAAAAIVLAISIVGTALTHLLLGLVCVLVLTSLIAIWLWIIAHSNHTGPLPTKIRIALLTVWLSPIVILWGMIGLDWVESFIFPRQLPEIDGVIEKVAKGSPSGVELSFRVVPAAPGEKPKHLWLWTRATVNVPPNTHTRGEPKGGPQVGMRARVWLVDFRDERPPFVEYIEYLPAEE